MCGAESEKETRAFQESRLIVYCGENQLFSNERGMVWRADAGSKGKRGVPYDHSGEFTRILVFFATRKKDECQSGLDGDDSVKFLS